MVISGYTPHPDRDRKVLKSSLGAEKTVPVLDFRNTSDAVNRANEEGFHSLALETGGVSLAKYISLNGKLAVRVGNETNGLLRETMRRINYHYTIPMRGHKASLNVGQAAAIAMRELSS